MTDEQTQDRVTSLTTSDSPSPQEVKEVLCREVGASHPDGALRQIRTMKKLLRSHYRVKQRLEEYGVESLSDAVAHIAELRRQVRQYRKKQREHALERMDVLDNLMDALNSMQRRLHAREPDEAASQNALSGSSDVEVPFEDINELIGALEQALDELRLELWIHQDHDEDDPSPPVASTAEELLDRLADAVEVVSDAYDRLQAENEHLSARNDALERDVDRLEKTVEQKEARIQELERELAHHSTHPDA